MSAYLKGYDYHSHFSKPIANNTLTAYDLEDDDISLDFDVVERDIDAEMEARHQQRQQPPPRTVSQRMLQSLRAQARAHHAAVRTKQTSATRDLSNSTFDVLSVLNGDTSVATTERHTGALDAPLSSRSGSSCTDRLEARISKTRRDSGQGLEVVNEAQDASLLYSGRRTYPAESLRKTERVRFSDNPTINAATPQETRMMGILDKERAARVFRSQTSCPEEANTKGGDGVRFHFRRGTSVDDAPLNGRLGVLALTDGRTYSTTETALVRVQSPKRMTDQEYTTLASQLAEIEALVDGIQSCMKTPTFSSLAGRVLKEMQLLVKTTQQIRTNGTTLILANVGKEQNADFTQALRRLVARAASVQKRIDIMMYAVQTLVV